jgi:hypothetical protein
MAEGSCSIGRVRVRRFALAMRRSVLERDTALQSDERRLTAGYLT